MVIVSAVGSYLFTINLIAFLLFGWDKRQARMARYRVPEKTLLMSAAIGGSVGAKLGQRHFRHKTRKQPFATLLNLVVLGQIGMIGLLAGTQIMGGA